MSKKVDDPSKFGGNVNKLLGTVREKTGKVIGNKSMEAKGHMQREMGVAEIEAAKRKHMTTKAEKQAQKQQMHGGTTAMNTPPSYTDMNTTPTTATGTGTGTGTGSFTQGPFPTDKTTVSAPYTNYDVPTPPPNPPSFGTKQTY